MKAALLLLIFSLVHLYQARRTDEENEPVQFIRTPLQRRNYRPPENPSENSPEFASLDPVRLEALFLEQLARNSNPMLRPSSMRRLEKEAEEEHSHYDADRELESSLPYGIQNVLEGQSVRLPRSKGHNRVTFQSLCPSRREMVMLNGDSEFEYRPDHYEEVTCAPSSVHEFKLNNNELSMPVCTEAGFSCIQLNRTLFLTRRALGGDCWESETRLVPAGCECMWPKHHLGDIKAHH